MKKKITIKSLHKITRWSNGKLKPWPYYSENVPENPDFVEGMIKCCGKTFNGSIPSTNKIVYAEGWSWLKRWVIINE